MSYFTYDELTPNGGSGWNSRSEVRRLLPLETGRANWPACANRVHARREIEPRRVGDFDIANLRAKAVDESYDPVIKWVALSVTDSSVERVSFITMGIGSSHCGGQQMARC